MIFNIQLINLIRALSLALELSTAGLSRHHYRTAMIASRIAEHVDLDSWQRQVLVYAALLHDLGAAASWEEKKKLLNIEVDGHIYKHAEEGYNLLKDSSQMGFLAEPIRHHHDYWDGSSPSGLSGNDIPLLSRIINVADRLEVMIKSDVPILAQRADILSAIRKFSGTYFDPEIVRALHAFARQESFWLDLTNAFYYQNFFQQIDNSGRIRLGIEDIIDIGEIFAGIIDKTSRFTAKHSRSVASVSSFLAMAKGYSIEETKMIRVAGLFHDLGKLAVPSYILEKPGKLTDAEFVLVKQHPYYTYRILEQIDGFSYIAEWAAYHHETLDGTGYPFGIKGDSLILGSRIVAVADVFAALTEHRSYRQPIARKEAENIMRSMVDNQKLDGKIVSELFGCGDDIYSLVRS